MINFVIRTIQLLSWRIKFEVSRVDWFENPNFSPRHMVIITPEDASNSESETLSSSTQTTRSSLKNFENNQIQVAFDEREAFINQEALSFCFVTLLEYSLLCLYCIHHFTTLLAKFLETPIAGSGPNIGMILHFSTNLPSEFCSLLFCLSFSSTILYTYSFHIFSVNLISLFVFEFLIS